MKSDLLTMAKQKTKVAIVGFSDSRKRAPFDEPEWEIWGLNQLYEKIPRWDRWFELHKRQVNLDDEGPDHIWKLAAFTCPIYMQKHYEDIPTSVEYPLKQVIAAFGSYLTSSFSFMAALAIMEGFQEIGIYGVDTADEEWGSQRPSLEYFLGYARGKGIKITIPAESSLLRAPFLYGYQERACHEFFGKLLNHEQDYSLSHKAATELARKYEREAARYEGAMEAIRELRREWQLPFQSAVAQGDEECESE